MPEAPAHDRGAGAADPPGGRARTVLGAVVVLGTGAVLRTAARVRSLRARGSRTPALRHELDVPGAGPPRRVVVLGDSAAAGHGLPDADTALARRLGRALAAADGRATEVRCAAVDGATTSEVLATQLDAAVGAEVVVVGVGVNDALHLPRVAQVATDLHRLLTGVQVRVVPGGRVVLLSCPDLSRAPGLPRPLRLPVGYRCRRVARNQARVAAAVGVPVVAVDRSLLDPEVFGHDGFHPGELGHERLADATLAWLL